MGFAQACACVLLDFFERVWRVHLCVSSKLEAGGGASAVNTCTKLRIKSSSSACACVKVCYPLCVCARIYSMDVPLIHLSPGRIRAHGTFWDQIFFFFPSPPFNNIICERKRRFFQLTSQRWSYKCRFLRNIWWRRLSKAPGCDLSANIFSNQGCLDPLMGCQTLTCVSLEALWQNN